MSALTGHGVQAVLTGRAREARPPLPGPVDFQSFTMPDGTAAQMWAPAPATGPVGGMAPVRGMRRAWCVHPTPDGNRFILVKYDPATGEVRDWSTRAC